MQNVQVYWYMKMHVACREMADPGKFGRPREFESLLQESGNEGLASIERLCLCVGAVMGRIFL